MSATMLPDSCCGASDIAAETITGRNAHSKAPKTPNPAAKTIPEPKCGIAITIPTLSSENSTIK